MGLHGGHGDDEPTATPPGMVKQRLVTGPVVGLLAGMFTQLAAEAEPDSATRRQIMRDSRRVIHPVAAAGQRLLFLLFCYFLLAS